MTGKTTLALHLSQAWAAGASPWQGAPLLPGSGVLLISREQPGSRVAQVLGRLAAESNADGFDRITLFAADQARDPETRQLFCLDATGMNSLRRILREARAADAAIGLVVLDSLSRLKPATVEEQSNDGMTRWLDELESIALEFGAFLLLIHHEGHGVHGQEREARSAGRGASAIGAVASVMLRLTLGRHQRQRVLEVDGNMVLRRQIVFDVAEDDDEGGAIQFFRRVDALSGYLSDDLLKGGPLSTNELAWRLSGRPRKPGRNPSGSCTRLAEQLRDKWVTEGIAELTAGPHGAKLIRLVDLATSLPPLPEEQERPGDSTSPTAPIEARGSGEAESVPAPQAPSNAGSEVSDAEVVAIPDDDGVDIN
jgi:hypothetical protein